MSDESADAESTERTACEAAIRVIDQVRLKDRVQKVRGLKAVKHKSITEIWLQQVEGFYTTHVRQVMLNPGAQQSTRWVRHLGLHMGSTVNPTE